MAKARSRGGRALVWLAVLIAGLIGMNAAAVQWGGGSWSPSLALDLEGGTQIVLEPQLADGVTSVTQEQLDQAVAIIRQRVDASGVSEAEITTQGGRNIVVALPGEPDAATMQRIQASAKMEFRAVLQSAAWVGMALYGLGSREDYAVGEALAYPVAAAVIWGILRLAAKPNAGPGAPPQAS